MPVACEPLGSHAGALDAATAAGPSAVPPIAVRPLTPSDFDAVKAAHGKLFPIDYDDSFFHKATHGLDRIFSWGAFAAADGGSHYTGSGGDWLVGFVTARVVRLYECDTQDRNLMGLLSMVWDHESVVYILTLGVVDGWRGRGIASRLIGLVSQYAAETRCRAAFLHVISYNDAAMRLYGRAGFSCAGRLPGFYYIQSGRQPDPSNRVYDAFLFAQHTAPEWGGYSGWDVVSLAWSPLRTAWGRIYGCMPQAIRHQQEQAAQMMQQLPAAPAVRHAANGSCTQPMVVQWEPDWQQQHPQQQQQQRRRWHWHWQQRQQQEQTSAHESRAGLPPWEQRNQHLQQQHATPYTRQCVTTTTTSTMEAASSQHQHAQQLQHQLCKQQPPPPLQQQQHSVLRWLFSPQWRTAAVGDSSGASAGGGGGTSGRPPVASGGSASSSGGTRVAKGPEGWRPRSSGGGVSAHGAYELLPFGGAASARPGGRRDVSPTDVHTI